MIQRFNVDELKKFTRKVFIAAGIPENDVQGIAEVLVATDMRGISSHGVVRSARYIDCIQAGGIKAVSEPEIIKQSDTLLRVNAKGGLGIPASLKTIDRLIELGKRGLLPLQPSIIVIIMELQDITLCVAPKPD